MGWWENIQHQLATCHHPFVASEQICVFICYLGRGEPFPTSLARQHFGAKSTLVASPTIEGVFDHVREAEENLGLVPIQDCSGGTVYDTADSLIRTRAGGSAIREELALDIRIALLGHPRTRPDHGLFAFHPDQTPHPVAEGERYPRAKMKAVTSTALAAQKAAASRNAAALASPGVAEIYPLKVLEMPELGGGANQTHFFVDRPSAFGESPVHQSQTALIAALLNVCGSLHTFFGPSRGKR